MAARSLDKAVQQASPGAELWLVAGTYRLSQPLQIEKAISLIGAGMDQTRVICAAEDCVVRFVGEGRFVARDLTFAHEGELQAHVVEVAAGVVDLQGCCFTGGVGASKAGGGTGLYVHGTTQGTIARCEAVGNQWHGMVVAEQARPTLDANTCQRNKGGGIAYLDSAAGEARGNTCTANENGIWLEDQAQPTLEDNVCYENQPTREVNITYRVDAGGIRYSGSAAGVARRNTCRGNEDNGIAVLDQAQPTLEDNTCQENDYGIVYFDSAAGVARRNTCTANDEAGIAVGDQARPTLDDNTCQEHELGTGIIYSDSAAGVARRNTCTANEDGIWLEGRAQPTLEDNICHENMGNGIAYDDTAGGIARRNTCRGNGAYGIAVASTAHPDLANNACYANQAGDILDRRRAEAGEEDGRVPPTGHLPTPLLDRYGRDLTQEARESKLQPVIGRKKEMLRLIQILKRKTKNNPVLIGEAGVGKTAVVEGLAQRIVSGEVRPLRGKRLIEVSMASLVAGTKYRGEFEERLVQLKEEARSHPDIILFVDELHTVIATGAAEGGQDAANILKPALARGELRLIGATTIAEYRRHIEHDAALERRFQPVLVNEPSVEETLEMLRGLKSTFEMHHDVDIGPDALEAAVELTVRYVPQRQLPDKALDVLDEACSRVSLLTLSDAGPGVAAPAQVTREAIADVIAEWTGVPIENLTEDESSARGDLARARHRAGASGDERGRDDPPEPSRAGRPQSAPWGVPLRWPQRRGQDRAGQSGSRGALRLP
jgi:parallel beta-helix repeat protein